MLQKTMNLLLQIIQTNGTTPSQKDGALHMIGTMADILLKKPVYKEQVGVGTLVMEDDAS